MSTRDYAKMQAMDRTQELKNKEYDDKLHELKQSLNQYCTKEDLSYGMQDKVTSPMLEQLE